MAIATINPATGESIKMFAPLTDPQIDEKIEKAEETFRSYRWSSFADRGKRMLQAARILEEEQDRFGRMMTLEMGKPIKAAKAEALKCAWVCRYYVENGERFLAEIEIKTEQGDRRDYRVAFDKIHQVLGYRPRFTVADGIREIAEALASGRIRDPFADVYHNYRWLKQHAHAPADGAARRVPATVAAN